MKRLALAVLAVLTLACGSSSPTAPSTPAPAPAPTPAPPPPPTFPSVSGVWNGTVAITLAAIEQGQSVTAVCNLRFSTGQTGSNFSGSLSISSTTATNATNCSGGLNYSGSVSTAGAVAMSIIWPFDDASCGLESTPQVMSGTVTGKTQKLKQVDVWLCSKNTLRVTRTIQIDLAQ